VGSRSVHATRLAGTLPAALDLLPTLVQLQVRHHAALDLLPTLVQLQVRHHAALCGAPLRLRGGGTDPHAVRR
jgi:hypothetical protein